MSRILFTTEFSNIQKKNSIRKSIANDVSKMSAKANMSGILKSRARNMAGATALAAIVLGGLSNCTKEPIIDYYLKDTKQNINNKKTYQNYLDKIYACNTIDFIYNSLTPYEKFNYTLYHLGLLKEENFSLGEYSYWDKGEDDSTYTVKKLHIPYISKPSYSYEDSLNSERVYREYKSNKVELTLKTIVLSRGGKYNEYNLKIREETTSIKPSDDNDGGLVFHTVSSYNGEILNGEQTVTKERKLVPNFKENIITEYEKQNGSWVKVSELKSNGIGKGYTRYFSNGETQTITNVRNKEGLPKEL